MPPARRQLGASLCFLLRRRLRSSPRFFVKVVICFIFVYSFAIFAPKAWLHGGYRKLLTWTGRMDPSITGPTEDLRVIVFGSQDIMGSAVSDTDPSRTSWTLHLCKMLGCTSYLSLVPAADETPGLTSNSVYQTVLDEFLSSVEGADLLKAPAADYRFLNKQYPVPPKTPDLAAQVQQFLSLPPHEVQSRSTIWIFTFGTWDIWNLAAIPEVTASDALNDMIKHIFEQAELLYLKALNPKSIAFSNFWTNMTKSDMATLMAQTTSEIIDERALESFRLLIPKLLDITQAPIWQARQEPPYPHTRAQQLRNAVALTRLWNKKVEEHFEEWQKKGRSKPQGIELEGILSTSSVPSTDQEVEDFANKLPAETKQQKGEFNLVFAPYPKRMGALLPVAEVDVTAAMMEAEMQRGNLRDSAGNGGRPVNDSMHFRNTWTPCFESTMRLPAGQERQTVISCDNLDDYMFHDENTLCQRAINDIASRTAKDVLKQLFPPQN